MGVAHIVVLCSRHFCSRQCQVSIEQEYCKNTVKVPVMQATEGRVKLIKGT